MKIFENLDSIKVIKLSNNDTIVLSKNYGIIKFPLVDSTHKHMNLVGIEGRNLGLVIPKFKDFYNFNVGDVFCYKGEGVGHASNSLNYTKITVKNKIIKGDSILYLNRVQSYTTRTDLGMISNYYVNKDSTFVYIDNADDFLNKYGDQITNLKTIGGKYKPVVVSRSKSIIDTISAITKSYPMNIFDKVSGSDIIACYNSFFPPSDLNVRSYSSYGTNLGLISSVHETYSSGSYNIKYWKSLIGCIRNGIVHGTILSDSLLNSISNLSIEKLIINVYPNPANFEITIEYLENNKGGTLTILNMNGQELIRQQIRNRKTQIDISNLKSGGYFLKLITDKTVEVRKIIKE